MGSRPIQATVRAQQEIIDQQSRRIAALEHGVSYIARLAGVAPQVQAVVKQAMQRQADVNNPAEPIPDPPSEAAPQTTEQALAPDANDDVRNPGITPGSTNDLAADYTTTPMVPGQDPADQTQPFNQLVDVTAPIQGTETHVPNDQTKIETDVRVGDPMNPEVAFPWQISPNQSNASKHASRTTAAIRLARLRIQARVVEPQDDLGLGAQIEASRLSDETIMNEINTLSSVLSAQAAPARPAHLVPRAASQVARTTPSLTSEASFTAQAGVVAEDTADADLFD